MAVRVADVGNICEECEAAEALEQLIGAIRLQAYGLADLSAKFRRRQRMTLRNQAEQVEVYFHRVEGVYQFPDALRATLAEVQLCLMD